MTARRGRRVIGATPLWARAAWARCNHQYTGSAITIGIVLMAMPMVMTCFQYGLRREQSLPLHRSLDVEDGSAVPARL